MVPRPRDSDRRCDLSPNQVMWRKFDVYTVAGKNLDTVPA